MEETNFNLQEIQQMIEAGEFVGGFLYLGSPAQTVVGQQREQTCWHSEGARYGQEWLDLSRCPKQILYSCDGCLKHVGKPFYQEMQRSL